MKIGDFKTMADDLSAVHDYFENGECSKCGNCCGRFLPLSTKEINQIKAYIKKHSIKQNFHSINVLNQKVMDYTCPFLNDSKTDDKCEIYPVRPLICKEFTCRSFIEGYKPSKEMVSTYRPKVDMVETFFGDIK